MNKVEKLTALCIALCTIFIMLTIKLISDDWFEDKFTNYIIENSDDVKLFDSTFYTMDTCYMHYYDEVTIKVQNDSSLYIIFWGDRSGSWLWDFKKDKTVDFNIPYLRYKGKNVDKYIEVLNTLNK